MHNPKDSIKEGYELTDLNHKLALGATIAVIAIMFAGMGVTVLYYKYRAQVKEEAFSQPNTLVLLEDDQRPQSGPILQGDPVKDRIETVTAHQAYLNSYGWNEVHGAGKRAHIPIEKAIELVANSEGTLYRQEPTVATEQ